MKTTVGRITIPQTSAHAGESFLFFRALVFTLVLPCLITLFVPALVLLKGWEIFSWQPGFLGLAGLFLFVCGALIYFKCTWDFIVQGKGTPAMYDSPKFIVRGGLYRYVRNPIYVSYHLVVLGIALFFGSTSLLAYLLGQVLACALVVRLYEEPHLKWKFGASYEDYCRRVPRWIPHRSAL